MRRYIPAIFLVLVFLAGGCSQSLYMKGKIASEKGQYDTAVNELYEALREQPDDYRAWRELGMVYYKQDMLEKAEEALGASNRIKPNALSNLYLGLIFERTDQVDKAIRVYGAAMNLQGDGRTKRMIEERLDVLIDKRLMQEARAAVENEDTLAAVSLPENSIAVINFDGSTLPRELEPLALGMAEFTAMDLAKISRLNVLERIKINVILDELEISQSKYADSRIAPRVGRLLGSRRIVLGAVTSPGENKIRIDGKLVNTVDNAVRSTESREAELDRFFDVQKDFVFNLIDTLGIELSKQERDAIEEVPTESLLAFMAYSEGLYYQKRGMYDDASRSFRSAGQHDPKFFRAASMAGKMESTASYNRDVRSGTAGGTKEFEEHITTSMKSEQAGTGMDHIQAANLVNGNFILNNELYWNFGSHAIAPPGGGAVWSGFGVIVIRGDLDAD